MLMKQTVLCLLFSTLLASAFIPVTNIQSSTRSLKVFPDVSSQLTESDVRQLACKGYVVIPNFLSPEFVKSLRNDIDLLRTKDRFTAAKIGQDFTNNLNTMIRVAETCFLGEKKLQDLPSDTRLQLYQVLENLRLVLSGNKSLCDGVETNAPILDRTLSEFLYAFYPKGGYYRRHVDSVPNSASSLRVYSLLIYLNENWTERDGGYLRIHFDSGRDFLPTNEEPNYIDLAPSGGTLVCFKSDQIPHEVLDTNSERAVVVGWYNRPFSSADIMTLAPEVDKVKALLMVIAAALVSTGAIILLIQ